MPKRRATAVDASDGDDVSQLSSATKRARTQNDAPPAARSRDAKGKHAPPEGEDDDADEGDDDDHDENIEDMDDEDDEEFEARHQEAVRASIEGKHKKKIGSIAQHGIIERIEMHQFMCHKYLTFTFGPQINFIVGHNGSGKSAVLSSITVALGGKANSTGRGNGLKAFIREGQNAAEVSVTLKNQGDEAYKPDVYGSSITVTRRFTKDGSSSYKIKNKEDKVISTKREELSNICDHMNLQVDNPMNILTQDAARQFLSASHPKDKYHFFLKGTQLSQLSEEYDVCLENIAKTAKILAGKKSSIPALEEAVREADAKYEEAAKARDLMEKSEQLRRELAWAHVADKEAELSSAVDKVAAEQRQAGKAQEKIDDASTAVATAQGAVQEKTDIHDALGNVDDLNERSRELKEQVNEGKHKLAQIREEERRISEDRRAEKAFITETERQIEQENMKLGGNAQQRRDELNARLEQMEENIQQKQARVSAVASAQRENGEERERLQQEGQQAQLAHNNAKMAIENLNHTIETCRRQQRDNLAVFGNDLNVVMDRIKKGNWHGNTPVGPLGMFVKLRDPARHAAIMRVIIGSLMTSFAVTDARDADTLRQILQQTRNPNASVIVAQDDPFDFSAGEPQNGLTVLRALDVSNPYVLRILINSARIESTFLADTRALAEQIIADYGHGDGVAYSLDGFQVRRYASGGGSSNPVPWMNSRDPRNALFEQHDSASRLQHLQEQLKTAEATYQNTQTQTREANSAFDRVARELESLRREEKGLHQSLNVMRREKEALTEEVADQLPIGIAGLQDALTDAKAKQAHSLTQYELLMERKRGIDETQRPLQQELERLKRQIAEFEGQRRATLDAVEEAALSLTKAQKDLEYYKKKLDERKIALGALEETAKDLEIEFATWTQGALTLCHGERVKPSKKYQQLQRDLEGNEKALKEREKRDGATVEEVVLERDKARKTLQRAKKDHREMMNLNRALRRSLDVRLYRWHEFRKHIALRCKMQFQLHLANRGYFGRVLFDHKEGKLELKVQTEEQAGTQSMDKDPKSLSGGEKSFSTICLLLSLWESIGCPLRCLDEFDVFMDAVNRRISMKMMIETAQASEARQYILISPQDAGSIKPSASVRIHRMADPERGQTTLNFS